MQNGVGQPGDAPQADGAVEIGNQGKRAPGAPERRLRVVAQQCDDAVAAEQIG